MSRYRPVRSAASTATRVGVLGAPPPKASQPVGMAPQPRRRFAAVIAGPMATLKSSDWNMGLVGLLLYMLAVITFRWPIAPYAVGVMALGVLVQRKMTKPPPFAIGLLCILVWSLIGVATSDWPEFAMKEWIELGKVVIICFLMPQVLDRKENIMTALMAHVVLFMLYPARGGIFNRLAGETDVGRWKWNYIYANPNDYASLAILVAGSTVALMFLFWHKRLVRTALIAALLVFLTIIVMTQSRGCAIGLLFGFVVFARYASPKIRKYMMIFSVAIAISIPILLPREVINRYMASLTDEGAKAQQTDARVDMARGSTEERTELLKIGLRIARDNALVGVGWGAYAKANAIYAPEKGARDTHNTYVNLAAEAGIPALLLFLGLIALTIVPCHRAIIGLRTVNANQSLAMAGMVSALAAFLVAGFFGSYAKILFLYVFMAFTFCLARALFPSSVTGPVALPRRTRR